MKKDLLNNVKIHRFRTGHFNYKIGNKINILCFFFIFNRNEYLTCPFVLSAQEGRVVFLTDFA